MKKMSFCGIELIKCPKCKALHHPDFKECDGLRFSTLTKKELLEKCKALQKELERRADWIPEERRCCMGGEKGLGCCS